jgi:hypothetical protein
MGRKASGANNMNKVKAMLFDEQKLIKGIERFLKEASDQYGLSSDRAL